EQKCGSWKVRSSKHDLRSFSSPLGALRLKPEERYKCSPGRKSWVGWGERIETPWDVARDILLRATNPCSAVPTGLRHRYSQHPGLTSWAKIIPPCGLAMIGRCCRERAGGLDVCGL